MQAPLHAPSTRYSSKAYPPSIIERVHLGLNEPQAARPDHFFNSSFQGFHGRSSVSSCSPINTPFLGARSPYAPRLPIIDLPSILITVNGRGQLIMAVPVVPEGVSRTLSGGCRMVPSRQIDKPHPYPAGAEPQRKTSVQNLRNYNCARDAKGYLKCVFGQPAAA